MYQTHKTFVTPAMSMWDLLSENSRLLLLLEHFEIDFSVGEKSVRQLCVDNSISAKLFLSIANLYNGFYPDARDLPEVADIVNILRFLTNSHNYYKEDKYPEITGYITLLHERTGDKRVKMIEDFFKSYFDEVVEHLDYEDKVAFPYFLSLVDGSGAHGGSSENFSAMEYSTHHSDIETKLADLKSLLLKHVPLDNELSLRRKLLFSLQELEYDLLIHASIEESLLLPLANKIEEQWGSAR
ncbi:MAG: hemerythrin domain-containing protein [Bacteroidales bacterium]|nr:hemerythrin domain-containing protein [Bacteroidales bacterium]MDD4431074.1 hemerythrin domain-containing protein [Bacteroidales bacterium]